MTQHTEMPCHVMAEYIGRVNDARAIDSLAQIAAEIEARFPQDEATPTLRAITELKIRRLAARP